MALEKCTGSLYNNKLRRRNWKGAAEHSPDLDDRLLNSSNTAFPSLLTLSCPPADHLRKPSQKTSTFGSCGECWLSLITQQWFYIPRDGGISFNGALMTESLKKILSVEGEFLLSLLSEPRIFETQERRGGNYWWITPRVFRLILTSHQVQQVPLFTSTELSTQNRINSTAAGSSCVICAELCRIRSASFGPIRKQIKAMWAQAHAAGSWDSGSWVNKGPACLSTAHPWGGTWATEQRSILYCRRDWSRA